jgi:glycerophosphoryl diester phosphodiesterase
MNWREISYEWPLIIGHRGASASAPENTIVAFKFATNEGAHGLEFDVRLASDGVPVVIHDATLDRTVMTPGAVERHPSTALSRMCAGNWFNLSHPDRARALYEVQCIPTLPQVFQLFGSYLLYVEMKCEEPARRLELARAVVGLVRDHGLAGSVVVKSFEHDSLREVKRLAPEIRTAALFGRSWPHPFVTARRIIAEAEACGADEISLHHSLLRAATVREARRRGFEVLAWTVNSTIFLRRALGLGLRAVFTDEPARMLNYLNDKLDGRGYAPRENG